MWHYAPWAAFPQIQCGFMWDFVRNTYDSVQEALDNGEPYTWKKITFEDWKEQFKDYNWTEMSNVNRFLTYLDDFGTDNIIFDLNINFATLASEEEAQVISMYESDLKTYLSEMTTNYIVGSRRPTPMSRISVRVRQPRYAGVLRCAPGADRPLPGRYGPRRDPCAVSAWKPYKR